MGNDVSTRVPFWKRRRVWGVSGVVLAVFLLAFCTYQLLKSPVDNVKWAYTVLPLPGVGNKQPLFPDRQPDREQLSKVLSWIDQAKVVTDENLSWPRRSEELIIVMKDGRELAVDDANSCRKTGPNSGTCYSVNNRVTIQDSNRKPSMYFADSPELFKFLQVASRNHKTMKVTNYPNSVTVGSTFQVSGEGWLTDKVTVSLKNGDQVLWSGTAVPDHGAFSMQVKCPPDIAPGDYSLEYSGENWGTIGNTINIYKPV